MTKYEGVTAVPQTGAGTQVTDTAYAPSYETMVQVPLGHARNIAGAGGGFTLLAGAGVIVLANLHAEPKAWVVLVIGAALVYALAWLLVYDRQRQAMYNLARREVHEQRDLNGDGVIGGRVVPVNHWLRRAGASKANAAATEKALMLRFVAALYEPGGTTYTHLRGAGFGTNEQIATRLVQLSLPEWGIVRFEVSANGGRRAVVVMPKEQALAKIERGMAVD